MGYTVSWTFNRSFTNLEWQQITDATRSMFNRLKQVKGCHGQGRPLIDKTEIIFNGDILKGEAHETFMLSRYDSGHQFCKTARKPYDRYVKAVLVLANLYAPDVLEVTCDGDDEEGCWDEGVRIATFYGKMSGRSPCSPKETKRLLELKSTDISHSDPYKGVYVELDNIIKGLELVSSDSKPLQFIVNYLKANIDDIKDAYTP